LPRGVVSSEKQEERKRKKKKKSNEKSAREQRKRRKDGEGGREGKEQRQQRRTAANSNSAARLAVARAPLFPPGFFISLPSHPSILFLLLFSSRTSERSAHRGLYCV